jgi:hypothetical protein
MKLELDHYRLRDVRSPVTGRPVNYFTCGPAVLWAPFFNTARITGVLLNRSGLITVDLYPWSNYYQYAVMYSAVLYVLCALFLLYLLMRPAAAAAPACMALALTLFATPLVYYTLLECSMSHAYDFFTLVLYLYLLNRWVHRGGYAAAVLTGLAAGLHVLVRTQNVLTVFLLSVPLVAMLRPFSRSTVLRLVAYGAAWVAGCLPLLAVNYAVYGNCLTIPQGGGFLDPGHPHILEVLFSWRNGLFAMHPVLSAGFIGYLVLLIHQFKTRAAVRWYCLMLLVAFLVQVYVNSITSDWWAGHAFGQRRLLGFLPLFALGFAALAECARRLWHTPAVIAGWVITALFVTLNFYLLIVHVFFWNYENPHNIWQWIMRCPGVIRQIVN